MTRILLLAPILAALAACGSGNTIAAPTPNSTTNGTAEMGSSGDAQTRESGPGPADIPADLGTLR